MAPIPLPLPKIPHSAQTTTILLSLSRRTSSLLHLLPRQSNNAAIIPTTYGSINSGPSPGAVVGIVLGSVAAFLLILWLLYICLSFGTVNTRSSYTESIVVPDRRRSRGSQRSRRETVEVPRRRTPVRIVREPSMQRPPQPPIERVERIVVEESRETRRERERSADSDEVVVIEEHGPPRRKKTVRREKRGSEDARREGGYRTVDPGAYAGVVGGRKAGRR